MKPTVRTQTPRARREASEPSAAALDQLGERDVPIARAALAEDADAEHAFRVEDAHDVAAARERRALDSDGRGANARHVPQSRRPQLAGPLQQFVRPSVRSLVWRTRLAHGSDDFVASVKAFGRWVAALAEFLLQGDEAR